MNIDELCIPAGYRGLRACSLSGLAPVVLLAGPNGGGKSRVLQAVRDNCITSSPDLPGFLRRDLLDKQKQLIELSEGAKTDPDGYAGQNYKRLSAEVDGIKRRLEGVPSIRPDPVPAPVLVDLSISDISFQDCGASGSVGWSAADAAINMRLDINLAIQHGPNALFGLLANDIASDSTRTELSEEDRESYRKRAIAFNSSAREILGEGFSFASLQEGPRIFGRSLASAQHLSAGQRLLLAFLYMLFFQADANRDVLIIWDEPENHLHPDAVIRILDKIRDFCPGAQMWIATHSVHILAHYQNYGIWFAQNGFVTRGGRVAENVLSSLLGGYEQQAKLSEFLSQPAQRAARLFAGQCLVPPHAVHTLPGDPQTKQIFEILSRQAVRPLNVLDFGSGKGRLFTELAAQQGALDAIEYFAYDYDPSEDDRDSMNRMLSPYGGSERYRTGEAKSVLSSYGVKFDVVVMCNVLHEVPPEVWLDLFGKDGAITHALQSDGFLLVVEDYVIAAGERAHRFGFLLFDDSELRALFNCSSEDDVVTQRAEGSHADRLKAHLVHARVTARVTEESIIEALGKLKSRSFARAKELHAKEEPTAKSGHAFAVAAHQHFNAMLALEAMS